MAKITKMLSCSTEGCGGRVVVHFTSWNPDDVEFPREPKVGELNRAVERFGWEVTPKARCAQCVRSLPVNPAVQAVHLNSFYLPTSDAYGDSSLDSEYFRLEQEALHLINLLRSALGRTPITAFTPSIVTEDTDCVLVAISEASELEVDWGEYDGVTYWLTIWDVVDEIALSAFKRAWDSPDRADGELTNVGVPQPLMNFAFKVSEGEYPELEVVP